MKKQFLFVVALMSCLISVLGQTSYSDDISQEQEITDNNDPEYFYYYKDMKVNLKDIDLHKMLIVFESSLDTASLREYMQISDLTFDYYDDFLEFPEIGSLKYPSLKCAYISSQYQLNRSVLASHPQMMYVSSCYYKEENKSLGVSPYLFVKLKSEDDFEKLLTLTQNNNVDFMGSYSIYMPDCYVLLCTKQSAGDALEMAKLLYDTNLFEIIQMFFNDPSLIGTNYYASPVANVKQPAVSESLYYGLDGRRKDPSDGGWLIRRDPDGKVTKSYVK